VAEGNSSQNQERDITLFLTLVCPAPGLSLAGESRDCVRLRGEYSAIQKRVGLAALGIFAEFEAAIKRDSSRVPPGGPGAGAVPKSTSSVMNYLALLYGVPGYPLSACFRSCPLGAWRGAGRVGLAVRG